VKYEDSDFNLANSMFAERKLKPELVPWSRQTSGSEIDSPQQRSRQRLCHRAFKPFQKIELARESPDEISHESG